MCPDKAPFPQKCPSSNYQLLSLFLFVCAQPYFVLLFFCSTMKSQFSCLVTCYIPDTRHYLSNISVCVDRCRERQLKQLKSQLDTLQAASMDAVSAQLASTATSAIRTVVHRQQLGESQTGARVQHRILEETVKGLETRCVCIQNIWQCIHVCLL